MSTPELPSFDQDAYRSVRSRTAEMKSAQARMISIVAREDEDGTIELIYLFDRDGRMTDFRFRILPDWEIDSVADIIPGAMNMERELVDLFGLRYKGVKSGLLLEAGKSPLTPLRRPPAPAKEVDEDC
jgi:Ni,Fe-hydrogenase III component G